MIWTAPGDVNLAYIVTAPSPADFSSPYIPEDATFEVLRAQQCNSTGDGIFLGSLIGSSGGAPTDPMTVGMGSAPSSLPAGKPCSFRTIFSGLTVHLIASAVTDQGQVYAAQYPSHSVDRGAVLVGNNVYATPLDVPTVPMALVKYPTASLAHGQAGEIATQIDPLYYAKAHEMVMPTNETDLAATAPGYYTDAAREGVYVPLKLSGPAQPFARAVPNSGDATCLAYDDRTGIPGISTLGSSWSESIPVIRSTQLPFSPDGPVVNPRSHLAAVGAIPLFVPTTQASAVATVSQTGVISSLMPWPFQLSAGYTIGVQGGPPGQLPNETVRPNGLKLALDTGFNNTNNAFVLFRGLQGGGGGGFASSLQVKMMTGLEIIPSPMALDRVFVEKPAAYDPKALELYYQYALLFADAYPARYNSLGELWDKIKDAAEYVWNKGVKPVARAFLPAMAGAAANAFAPGAGSFVTPIVAGLVGAPPGTQMLQRPDVERHGAIDSRAVPAASQRRDAVYLSPSEVRSIIHGQPRDERQVMILRSNESRKKTGARRAPVVVSPPQKTKGK
jgi:uncharacterized membrane protein YeaQ/YmgE (transglycosylase-associated protein family)